jgi:hypothetical protein
VTTRFGRRQVHMRGSSSLEAAEFCAYRCGGFGREAFSPPGNRASRARTLALRKPELGVALRPGLACGKVFTPEAGNDLDLHSPRIRGPSNSGGRFSGNVRIRSRQSLTSVQPVIGVSPAPVVPTRERANCAPSIERPFARWVGGPPKPNRREFHLVFC